MTSRITKVNTGQYHQVLAITQHMINQGLENLFIKKATTIAKNYLTLGNGFKNMVFGSPKIIIETLDDNHTNIFYRIHLKSGNYATAVDGPNGTTPQDTELARINYVINDWYFTFMVDLAQIVLTDDDPKKAEALKTMKRMAGKYTVQQLMVNMKTAKINSPDPSATSFGVWTDKDKFYDANDDPLKPDRYQVGQPRVWDKEPQSVQNGFKYIITMVLDALQNADLQNLGVTAEAVDAGRLSVTDPGHPPTFMPVDCRFQTYPWMEPGNPNYKEINSIDGNGRLNYLLYLEMTGNYNGTKPEVKQDGRFLKEVGNWTDGRTPGTDPPSKFGTFILTYQKFWTEFLLPKFDKMNRMVMVDLKSIKAGVYTKGIYSYFPRDLSLAIGEGVTAGYDAKDQEFRFGKEDSSGWNNALKALPANLLFPSTMPTNALVWYWHFFDTPISDHNTDRYFDIGYRCEHWGNATSTTITRLYLVPGENKIKFEGVSFTSMDWTQDWDIVPNKKMSLTCKAVWGVTVTMVAVSDGGLQFQIDAPDPKLDFSGENKGDLAFYETYLRNSYITATSNFRAILNALKNSLEGQEKFFLPASGVFFFKNPVFNFQGSLLCDLEYNGNATIETPNQDAAARSALGNTTVQSMPGPASNLITDDRAKKDQ